MTSTGHRTELSSDLRISVTRLARRLRTERADHGLTLGQVSMLATLDRHGPLTAGELALHEGIRPPSATRTLASLDELGLITRACSETDRRQSVISITDAARDLLHEDRRRRDALLADLLDQLSDDERRVLAQASPLLDRLAGL
ncbi:MAG: MarR family transcriptional regulator [Actinomycetes bacterium]